MKRHEVGLREARTELGNIVSIAQFNKVTTVITRNGKPAAMVTPYSPEQPELTDDEFMKALAELIADLEPHVGDDPDTGLFVVAPVAEAAWVRASRNPYGSATVHKADDAVGSMTSGTLAWDLRTPEDAARVIRALRLMLS